MVDGPTITLFAAEALAGLLGFAAGFSLLRSYRMVGALGLRRLGVGLLLLAFSQMAALFLELLVYRQGTSIPREGFDLFDASFWLHYGFLLMGLGYVFRSFGRHPFRWMPVMAPLLLRAGPILELLSILVLFFIVLHAGLNHIARKGTGSIRVAIGFFLLFTAHTLNLIGYTALAPRWWLAEIVNLGGFAILFVAVKRPRVRTDA